MSKIGRNDPCPCGSGKKYKNCCLGKESSPRQEVVVGLIDNPYYIVDGNFIVPLHNSHNSIKDCAIAQLEQMIGFLDVKKGRDDLVRNNCTDLMKLAEKGEDYYYNTIIKEMLTLGGGLDPASADKFVREKRKNATGSKLSLSENIIINHIATSNLLEYAMKTDFNEIDYGAMRVLAEFGQQVLSSDAAVDKIITGATLYVDKDELKSWELHFSEDNDISPDINKPLHIRWVPLNKLDHFATINKAQLPGLTTDSQNKLATALAIEEQFTRDANSIFSFSSLGILYLGIVENELGNIISTVDESKKDKQMMWYDLYKYVKDHNIPVVSDNLPLDEILEELRPIRNRVAHGEMVTPDDYEKIKRLTYENQLIEFISWAKTGLTGN